MNKQTMTPKEVKQMGMQLLRNGRVRNHKLGNSARIHTGQMEKEEYRMYRNNLPTQLSCVIYGLKGSDDCE